MMFTDTLARMLPPGRAICLMILRSALVAGIVLVNNAIADQAGSLQQANTAFQNGQYQQALRFYRQAEKQGVSQPAVAYNIAVCLYRTGDYDAAAKAFKPLLQLPSWQGLAQYNLGLVFEAQGNNRKAAHWFRQAEKKPNPEKIRQLAATKLNRITKKQAIQKDKNRVALYRAGYGVDDNPASIADESSQQQNSISDQFTELMLYGHTYLSGQKNDGVKIYGLGFSRQYRDFQQYDTHLAGIGLMHEHSFAAFNTGYGLQLTHIRTDQGKLANQLKLKLDAGYQSGNHYWSTTLVPAFYSAGDDYRQVEGWQEQLDIAWKYRFQTAYLKLRYRYEANQRDDLAIANRFYSYSPDRQSIRASLNWAVNQKWRVKWYSEYKESHYKDENKLTDSDGIFKQQQRENEQTRHQLNIKYKMVDSFSIAARFKYRDSDDNYRLYTYSKKEAALLLELLL